MTNSTGSAARPGTAEERRVRQSWWWLAVAFGALAVFAIVRIFSGPPQPVDLVLGGVVLVVGAGGVIHRRTIDDLEQSRRQEAETFTRILQGLSRSVSPEAIVGAIVDDLGAAAGADHTVVVRLSAEAPILEAILVSTRPGVPSSTTMLPLADLQDPGASAVRVEREREPIAIPIELLADDLDVDELPGSPSGDERAGLVAGARVGPAGRLAGEFGLRPMGAALAGPDRIVSPESNRRGAAEPSLALPYAGPSTSAVSSDFGRSAPPMEPPRTTAAANRVRQSRPEGARRIAERIAARVRTVYGLKNTIAAPLVTAQGVVGAIVLSRRTSEPWSQASLRVIASAAVEASAALERAYSHQEAEARASTDALTGLPNRRYFDEFCGLLARRRRADDAVGVLMIDIDHFKRLNDEFGHPVGDQVLRAVATAITRAVREGDVPARFGGEEFAVLLRNPGPGVARDIAERVRSAVASLDLAAFGPRGVTVSIGYAVAQEIDQSIPALVDQADQALYRAKRSGRDRVVAA